MEEEETEKLSAKDAIVLTAFTATTLIGFGVVARIGWELAGVGIEHFKIRRNAKKES